MGRKNKKKSSAKDAAAHGDEKEEVEEEDKHVPVDGSWVAELEDAQEELEEILESPGGAEKRRGDALKVYLRLCRSFRMLRQWDKLEDAAKKGLDVCASYNNNSTAAAAAGVPTAGASSKLSAWEGRFKSYRERAGRERSVPSGMDDPRAREMFGDIMRGVVDPNNVSQPHGLFPNSNMFHYAALIGDMPLMEALVAHGAAIDVPFFKEGVSTVVAPADATALLMVCINLALAEFDQPHLARARSALSHAWENGELDGSTKCAMQLVRLGADPNRTFNLDKTEDKYVKKLFRAAGFDGKSALELARMTKRKELVELMEQHLLYSPEERAHVVHCRCGSRLPWLSCHATGIGQPPHFRDLPELGVMYRFPPCARCPCNNTALAHYDCCWKESAKPAYLLDTNGAVARLERVPVHSHAGRVIREAWDRSGPNGEVSLLENEIDLRTVDILSSPTASNFRELFEGEGPKSRWESWDPVVYANCVSRLSDEYFLWKDLHWHLDKSEILKRTEAWNKALDKYCDDMDLVGEEREQVIARHKANPCAPCGRVGCDAFEIEVREFPRCSQCKLIAYCGRACQKIDWPEHRKCCSSDKKVIRWRSKPST